MFTPLRKAPPATPRSADKGKALAYVDGPPPPLGSLSLNRSGPKTTSDLDEDMNDWRRFKEVGLLDEASMERKDRQALAEKLSMLESELYDYQHNMGLLLIEKNNWIAENEEKSQALAETQEILKRQQRAHLIELSEAQTREENLRRILAEEKSCVAELQKSLREMHDQYTQIKVASAAKLADANALVVSVEDKSLVTDEKFLAAEAKLAEAEKKSLEVERRLQEVETRESVLRREQMSLNTEREVHKTTFYRQREDLKEWEKKLTEGDERLCKLRKSLSEKEEKTNEKDITLKQKEKDLDEAERKVQFSNAMLKEKEDDLSKRLADLVSKEKDVASLTNSLEMKDKELHALEEKLSSRENVEIHQLLDQHRDILDRKTRDFELKMEERSRSFDKELSSKVDAVEQRELEISHKEEKLLKQEQAFHEKSERLKEKNKEVEVNLKNLKEKEKTIKVDAEKLELDRQQILADIENLQNIKDEIQKIQDENVQLDLQIRQERGKLEVTDKERSDFLLLQSELQQEIKNYRLQNDLLSKEAEDLKEEREKFEKEWEDLDERRAKVSEELSKVVQEKEKLEKLQHIEEERLKDEKHAVQDYIQRETASLNQEKESFAAKMRNEQIALSERLQSERTQMVQDFESRRRDLETDVQKKQEEMINRLQERERAFEEEKDREHTSINYLKGVAGKQRDELISERNRNEKEREALALKKKELEVNQLEMREDIDQLDKLSKKIKLQREQLIEERSRFLSFVEKLKSCKDCGEITREFVLSDLQVPGMYHVDAVPDSEHKDAGWGKKLQQKCKLVVSKVASSKKVEHVAAPLSTELPPLPTMQFNNEENGKVVRDHSSHENEPQPSLRRCNDSPNAQVILTDVAPTDDRSFMDSKVQDVPEDSEQSKLKSGQRKPTRGRKSRLSRTRSVEAVVEEANSIIGKTPEEPLNASVLNDSSYVEESRADSSFTERGNSSIGRKRGRAQSSRVTGSEHDDCDSEGHSVSVTAGGHRKRRQTSAVQAPGQQRYNLRHRKTAGTSTAAPHLKTKEQPNPEALDVQLIQVTALKNLELTEEKVVRFETPEPEVIVDDNADADATNSVEKTESSGGNSTGGESDDGTSGESNGNYDDEEHPGQKSIGKKLWTFFTS